MGLTSVSVPSSFLDQQHLPLELRQVLFDRILDRQLALVLQDHDPDCRDRLGHRGDAEHRILRHRLLGLQILKADRIELLDALRVADNRYRTSNHPLVHELLHSWRDGFELGKVKIGGAS